MTLLGIFGARDLDAWRDRHTSAAAQVLRQVVADLIRDFEPAVQSATLMHRFVSPQAFIHTHVEPRLRTVTEAIVSEILHAANADLHELATHRAVWTRQPGAPVVSLSALDGAGDLALAAAPIAAGTAVGVALPALAATTSGGLLGTGLFATTVISWPVLAVGGAAVGVAWATGALNVVRMGSKAEDRLRAMVAKRIGMVLLSGTAQNPAVLEQFTALFAQTAREARRRRR